MLDTLLPLIYVVLGFALGFCIAYLLKKNTSEGVDLEKDFVPRLQYDEKLHHLQKIEEENGSLQNKIIELNKDNATLEANLHNLAENLENQKSELSKLQEQAQQQFKELASSILEEKSEKFKKVNKEELHNLLSPLREKISEFEKGIDRKFNQDAKDKGELKEAIEGLKRLNTKISQDALQLANALKGDSKAQGDWGELQLEQLLNHAGLQKGVHFETQNSFKDLQGQQKRPDFIINLPDDKKIIIDCKVSLTAYERYFSTEDRDEQKQHLKGHIDSIRNHIKGLSGKAYETLPGINTVDFVMLYVPLEPALHLALREQNDLTQLALEKNIILVSNTTLFASMRTVSYIWKRENQEKNAQEIARQSGLLYDKFVAFLEDMNDLGDQLNKSAKTYEKAMNKLSTSASKGTTIIGRAEKLRELGANSNKKLPQKQKDKLGLN